MKRKGLIILLIIFNIFYVFSQDKDNLIQLLDSGIWGISYYNDILKSGKRESIYKYAPFYKEEQKVYSGYLDDWTFWYDEHGSFTFNVIRASENELALPYMHVYNIQSVTEDEDSSIFRVNTIVTASRLESNEKYDKKTEMNWIDIHGKYKLTFIFVFDGDFLNVFVDDFDHYFGTYCRYNEKTWQELECIIRNNVYEPSEIELPKRLEPLSK